MSRNDKKPLKVAILNRSDKRGGAAVVSFRLMEALRNEGVDARMITCENLSGSPHVLPASDSFSLKKSFLVERLGIYCKNGFNRETLFQIDNASHGLTLHRHPFLLEADIICLNWINQGMLSLKEIEKIVGLGKPVVWTMHDQWNFTGICHHTGDCDHYLRQCGNCRLLGKRKSPEDLSHQVWLRKNRLYDKSESEKNPITFVPVSRWLAQRAEESSLLRGKRICVIPNAFPSMKSENSDVERDPYAIIFGAARLDDSVKGLSLLKDALRMLAEQHPEIAEKATVITFGNFKNPDESEGFAIRHHHLGTLTSFDEIARSYRAARCVISSSLFETLPGTLVEGQSNGAIPVSFDRGGQNDIIDHLETGYLAHLDPDDFSGSAYRLMEGIVWALTQAPPDIEKKMQRSVISKFDAQAVAKQYINLFESLL